MKRLSAESEQPAKKPKNSNATDDIKSSILALPSPAEIQKRLEAAKAQSQNALPMKSDQKQLDVKSALDPEKQGRGGINVGIHPLLMQKPGTKLNLGSSLPGMVKRNTFLTSKANQKRLDHEFRIALNAAKKPKLKIEKPPADFSNPYKNPYFDPKLNTSASAAPKEKYSRSIKFAPQGKFIEEANQIRANEHLEKLKEKIAATVRKTGMEADLDLVADDSLRRDPPPNAEWWDLSLLKDGSYDLPLDHEILSPEGEPIISNLIQHPIPILPPDSDNVPPMIVMLTKKERKKMRRQRRLEALKEKQDKINLGILPPDAPKVKIANLMNVLGNEAIQDPTKVETMVRKQMAERQDQHDMHNSLGKLTEEQRKEKKAQKLAEDTSNGVKVAVFRVKILNHPHFRFKVDRNAKQLNLSGTAILFPTFNMVIVEGGPKGIKFFKNLMLNRIDWTKFDETKDNECVLVWEGDLRKSNFRGFRFKPIPTEMMAKEFLENHEVVHYWNAAKNYVAEGL